MKKIRKKINEANKKEKFPSSTNFFVNKVLEYTELVWEKKKTVGKKRKKEEEN